MVGIVVTISPNFNLYKMVVLPNRKRISLSCFLFILSFYDKLPAASRPTIKIRISFLPKRFLNRFAKAFPIVIDNI